MVHFNKEIQESNKLYEHQKTFMVLWIITSAISGAIFSYIWISTTFIDAMPIGLLSISSLITSIKYYHCMLLIDTQIEMMEDTDQLLDKIDNTILKKSDNHE